MKQVAIAYLIGVAISGVILAVMWLRERYG